jgi:hypothetical protein
VPSPYRRRASRAELIIDLVAAALMSVLGGWAFMLAVGIVHHEWIKQCPTIGFGWALLLASLMRSALFLNENWRKREAA